MYKISVIIPIYNVEEYIKRCLDSILNQTWKNIEIICVDDCGKDDSMKIVESYQQQFPDIFKIVYNQENKGLGGARDAGLLAATGDYVSFIDSDDHIKSDFYEVYMSHTQEGKIDIVAGGYIREIGEERVNCPLDMDDSLSVWMNVSACTKIYKLDFLKKANMNFHGVRRYEDEGFFYRCMVHKPQVKMIPYEGYFYFLNENSITRTKNTDRTKIFEEYIGTTIQVWEDMQNLSSDEEKKIIAYCIASGVIANLLHNARGCKWTRMKQLYQLYDKVMYMLGDDIRHNKYIQLKYFKSESFAKRYAAWLVLRFRKMKLDKVLFLVDSYI